MDDETKEQIKALISGGISFGEWVGLDERGMENVREALYEGFRGSETDPPIFYAIESNVLRALPLFAEECATREGLTLLGATFSIDAEFYIYVEHSLFFDIRRIPHAYVNFRIVHFIPDVPEDVLVSAPAKGRVCVDDPLERCLTKYWRRISRAWGDQDLTEAEVRAELENRRVVGFVREYGKERTTRDDLNLAYPWHGANGGVPVHLD